MLKSHVVEVNGTFVGAAIAIPAGFRFHAVHVKVAGLAESTWLSRDELGEAVRHLFVTGNLSSIRHQVSGTPWRSAARSRLRAPAKAIR